MGMVKLLPDTDVSPRQAGHVAHGPAGEADRPLAALSDRYPANCENCFGAVPVMAV